MDKITKTFTRANAKNWPVNLEKILRHAWQNSEKDLRVTVEEDAETRRDKQNRLMWKWHSQYIKFRFETTGEIIKKSEHWHHVWKGVYIGSEPVQIKGKWELVPLSSTDLSVKEFALALQKYEADAANEGCVFTRPGDLYMDALMKQIDEQEN
jgi:hypothetical protein